MDELKLINEDGTDFRPPKHPLMTKWLKKYPPSPSPEFSQVCDGWSCSICGRCPLGSNWECPEEDKDVYEAYLREINDYLDKHNQFER